MLRKEGYLDCQGISWERRGSRDEHEPMDKGGERVNRLVRYVCCASGDVARQKLLPGSTMRSV